MKSVLFILIFLPLIISTVLYYTKSQSYKNSLIMLIAYSMQTILSVPILLTTKLSLSYGISNLSGLNTDIIFSSTKIGLLSILFLSILQLVRHTFLILSKIDVNNYSALYELKFLGIFTAIMLSGNITTLTLVIFITYLLNIFKAKPYVVFYSALLLVLLNFYTLNINSFVVNNINSNILNLISKNVSIFLISIWTLFGAAIFDRPNNSSYTKKTQYLIDVIVFQYIGLFILNRIFGQELNFIIISDIILSISAVSLFSCMVGIFVEKNFIFLLAKKSQLLISFALMCFFSKGQDISLIYFLVSSLVVYIIGVAAYWYINEMQSTNIDKLCITIKSNMPERVLGISFLCIIIGLPLSPTSFVLYKSFRIIAVENGIYLGLYGLIIISLAMVPVLRLFVKLIKLNIKSDEAKIPYLGYTLLVLMLLLSVATVNYNLTGINGIIYSAVDLNFSNIWKESLTWNFTYWLFLVLFYTQACMVFNSIGDHWILSKFYYTFRYAILAIINFFYIKKLLITIKVSSNKILAITIKNLCGIFSRRGIFKVSDIFLHNISDYIGNKSSRNIDSAYFAYFIGIFIILLTAFGHIYKF